MLVDVYYQSVDLRSQFHAVLPCWWRAIIDSIDYGTNPPVAVVRYQGMGWEAEKSNVDLGLIRHPRYPTPEADIAEGEYVEVLAQGNVWVHGQATKRHKRRLYVKLIGSEKEAIFPPESVSTGEVQMSRRVVMWCCERHVIWFVCTVLLILFLTVSSLPPQPLQILLCFAITTPTSNGLFISNNLQRLLLSLPPTTLLQATILLFHLLLATCPLQLLPLPLLLFPLQLLPALLSHPLIPYCQQHKQTRKGK